MAHSIAINKPILELIPENLEGLRILDCGMGHGMWGHMLRTLKEGTPYIVGLDAHGPYVQAQVRIDVYDEVYEIDLTSKDFESILKESKYDIVIATEIIEHLYKIQGMKFLNSIEKTFPDMIIISTPYGYMKVGSEDNPNPFQHHLSEWYPYEFEKLGFKTKIADMRIQMTRSIKLIDTIRRMIFRCHNAKEIIAWKYGKRD